jgi:hypothetical protein
LRRAAHSGIRRILNGINPPEREFSLSTATREQLASPALTGVALAIGYQVTITLLEFGV